MPTEIDYATRPEAPFTDRELRNVLGMFATGITIVTAVSSDGIPIGVTANSFTSVSLSPPLVLFCLNRASRSSCIASASTFAIHILCSDQKDVADRFARSSSDRWLGQPVTFHGGGCPEIKNALAVLECTRHSVLEGGDHVIVLGNITKARHRPGRPLLYYRGQYSSIPH